LITIEVGLATVACVVREKPKLQTVNEWKLTFPLAVLLLIVFLVIGPPYSNGYTILGSRQQLVFENGSSLIVFAPTMGGRTAVHLKKLARYQLLSYEESVVVPYVNGPAIVRRIDQYKRRDWLIWPNFTMHKDTDGKVRCVLGDVPEGMKSLSLLVDCPGETDCLTEVSGVTEVKLRKVASVRHGAILRWQPIYAPFDVNLTVVGQENVKVDVVFNWHRLTEEVMDFDQAFPAYVRP
jgi:hypothetical protein